MAKKMTLRTPNTANKVSHSQIKTKRKQKLNNQNTTINGVKTNLSVKEIRTMRKNAKKAA